MRLMSSEKILSSIESLLFIGGEPILVSRLAKILEVEEEIIEQSLEKLNQKYTEDTSSGLILVRKDKQVVLGTKPENAPLVEALTKSSMQENLSRVALEVLSIVLYRAPISRVAIEAIRGVNCSFTLRNLLLRDLIERQTNPSDTREYVYSPTFRLLQLLGVQNIKELPDYETLSVDSRLTQLLDTENEESEAVLHSENINIQKDSE